MTLKDLQSWVKTRLASVRMDGTRRPDGGTSCYRPIRRKNGEEERLAQNKAAEYAASEPQQIPYAHTGFTGMTPPADYSYAQSTINVDPYGYGAAQAAREEARMAAAQPVPEEMPRNNISYMPGVFAQNAGSTYTHVEHIMAMTSLRSCYEAIECMKNGETLIVSLDAIGNDSERIRCQDMLAGAAFTLGCSVRSINGGQIVLIAPADVKILPEQRSSYAEGTAPVFTPPYAAQPVQAEEYMPRRERRVSQNAAGWYPGGENPAPNYNPYTGSMPAAAGSYGSYGGYGY